MYKYEITKVNVNDAHYDKKDVLEGKMIVCEHPATMWPEGDSRHCHGEIGGLSICFYSVQLKEVGCTQ